MAISNFALQEKFAQRDDALAIIENLGLDLHIEVDDRGVFEVSKTFPLREVFRTNIYSVLTGFIEGFRQALDNS